MRTLNPYSAPRTEPHSRQFVVPADLEFPTVRVHLSKRFLAFAIASSVVSLGFFALILAYIYPRYLLTIDPSGVSTHGGRTYLWNDLTKVQRHGKSVTHLRFGKHKVVVLDWGIVERDSLTTCLSTLSSIP